jgi:hypothetical protein
MSVQGVADLLKPVGLSRAWSGLDVGWQSEAREGRVGSGLALMQSPTGPGRAGPLEKSSPDGRAWSGLGLGPALPAALATGRNGISIAQSLDSLDTNGPARRAARLSPTRCRDGGCHRRDRASDVGVD